MQNKYKILFIGDIVGRAGRCAVKYYLEKNKSEYDFIVANVENASHGFGLTKKNHDELMEYGINCFTSGNHIWDKKDILTYIEESPVLIRPYNYHKSAPGVGYRVFDNKIIVINLLGKTFMPPINCPFDTIETLMTDLNQKYDLENMIVLVDFHAEATAEKQCFAKYAVNLGVNCVMGTHTHVQTADETILDNKLAYITDAGFCGSKNGVIGMEYEGSYKRLLTSINERFEVETSSPYIFNACEISFKNSKPEKIKRLNIEYNSQEKECENEN